VAAVDREAERARAVYGMLVVPGLELTHNHPDPDLSAHAVAVGLREFVSPDLGLVGALLAARESGAAVIAAHPHARQGVSARPRTTRRFWREWDSLAPLLHRVELMNGADLYGWVVGADVPLVASGDVHRREAWKTLLPCASDEERSSPTSARGVPRTSCRSARHRRPPSSPRPPSRACRPGRRAPRGRGRRTAHLVPR
jgi:hypothetical protein